MGIKSSHDSWNFKNLRIYSHSNAAAVCVSRVRARISTTNKFFWEQRSHNPTFCCCHSFALFSINKFICFCFTSPSLWETSQQQQQLQHMNDRIWLTFSGSSGEFIKMHPDVSFETIVELAVAVHNLHSIRKYFMSKSHVISYILLSQARTYDAIHW